MAKKDNSKDVSNALRNAMGEVAALRAELDRTTLIVQAMWELIKKSQGVSEEQMLALINAVDALDGKVDGKPSRIPADCPSCARKVSIQTNVCFFCGTAVDRKRVF